MLPGTACEDDLEAWGPGVWEGGCVVGGRGSVTQVHGRGLTRRGCEVAHASLCSVDLFSFGDMSATLSTAPLLRTYLTSAGDDTSGNGQLLLWEGYYLKVNGDCCLVEEFG